MTARKAQPETVTNHQPADPWTQSELFKSMKRVPRPQLRRHKYQIEKEVEAILETVDRGDSVELELYNEADFRRAHMALRHAIRKHGEKFKYQKFGTTKLKVWAERLGQARERAQGGRR